MADAKKHHYIPQFLLRNFAFDRRRRLYVFDKRTDRVFVASVADAAAENRLYEFSIDGTVGTIEPSLAEFESEAASALAAVLSEDNLGGTTAYQRAVMSGLICHLLLRSPQQRGMIRHITAEARRRVTEMGADPDKVPQLAVFDANEEKQYTATVLPELTKQFAPVVAGKTWVLHGIPEEHTLYISDNPVTMHNERRRDGRGNLGLAVEGVEVYLPLSPHRCWGLYCPTVIAELESKQEQWRSLHPSTQPPANVNQFLEVARSGGCAPLPKQTIEVVNSLQVGNAERYVFAGVDDFDFARELLADHPRLRTGPRPEVS